MTDSFRFNLSRQIVGEVRGREVIAMIKAMESGAGSNMVHEIAVLADQRHRAGQALTSDPLEEWQRHSLPEFTERMRTRLRNHCQEDHQSWPAKGRYSRHVGEATRRRRMEAYAGDLRALKSTHDQDQSPRLGPVDLETGEIKQP